MAVWFVSIDDLVAYLPASKAWRLNLICHLTGVVMRARRRWDLCGCKS